ncbi:MAG: CBS domain-containing protein [Candidatus Pacearchaeota archaeon]|jgi:CBS domain-containing protein
MKISEVMSKAVIADESISIRQAAKIMSDKNIGSLIITKDNNIKGILTERDILKNLGKMSSKVNLVMSKNVITINSEESIDSAADLMAQNKIKRIPVIQDKKLVGIITVTDIIAHSKNLNDYFMFN